MLVPRDTDILSRSSRLFFLSLKRNFRSMVMFDLDKYLNASCNFVIYVLMNTNYREIVLENFNPLETARFYALLAKKTSLLPSCHLCRTNFSGPMIGPVVFLASTLRLLRVKNGRKMKAISAAAVNYFAMYHCK